MTILCNTVDGVLHDLQNLNPYELNIDTIATGLANQCRYNGQVKKFYSVAEHCVHLCRFVQKASFSTENQAAILMHDASEAYIGDVIRHLKEKLPEFIRLEDEILQKIFTHFGLGSPHRAWIKDFDSRICKDEMKVLMIITEPKLHAWVFANDCLGIKVKNWSPAKAKKEFLKECKRLRIK